MEDWDWGDNSTSSAPSAGPPQTQQKSTSGGGWGDDDGGSAGGGSSYSSTPSFRGGGRGGRGGGSFGRGGGNGAGGGGSGCFKCGEDGHRARDCPTAPKMTCYNCQGEGHMSRECTNPAVPRGGGRGGGRGRGGGGAPRFGTPREDFGGGSRGGFSSSRGGSSGGYNSTPRPQGGGYNNSNDGGGDWGSNSGAPAAKAVVEELDWGDEPSSTPSPAPVQKTPANNAITLDPRLRKAAAAANAPALDTNKQLKCFCCGQEGTVAEFSGAAVERGAKRKHQESSDARAPKFPKLDVVSNAESEGDGTKDKEASAAGAEAGEKKSEEFSSPAPIPKLQTQDSASTNSTSTPEVA